MTIRHGTQYRNYADKNFVLTYHIPFLFPADGDGFVMIFANYLTAPAPAGKNARQNPFNMDL